MSFTVRLDDRAAQAMLKQLAARGANMLPLMQDLGEHLTETSKQRFQTSTGPDGVRWLPNAPATYLHYLGAFGGSFSKKTGKITKAGAGRASSKKPLVGESKRLGNEIYYAATPTSVDVGSSLIYSAIHQLGGRAGRGGSVAIPARPYLGISAADSAHIQQRAAHYLQSP